MGQPLSVLEQLPGELDLTEKIQWHESHFSFRGGYANVHQGTLSDGTKVAIKRARGQYDGSRASGVFHVYWTELTSIQSVLHEIRVWSKLCHPNVVPFLGHAITENGSLSLVSPWQERGNARNYVRDPSVDPCPVVS